MAGAQDIFHLPVKHFDYKDPEAMALAIFRNFKEVERMLALLQGYIKTAAGGEAVKDITLKANIWDRAGVINPDGTIPVELLDDALVGLEHKLQLANEAVTEAKLAVGAITSDKIGADAVTEAKIAEAAITALKLANEAVTTAKIADEAVGTEKIAAEAITAIKIAAEAVGAAAIAAGAITTDKLAAEAVTAAKIAAGEITSEHISADGIIANKIIGGELLTALVNIVGPDGLLRMVGGALQVYDPNWNLRVSLGHYDDLGEQTVTFTRNSVAYKQDGAKVEVDQPRYEAGRFGQAVLVEEGTTNVVADPSFENADITANWNAASSSNWSYTEAARVRDTTYKKYGSASVKCGDGTGNGKGIAEKNQGTAAHAVSAGQVWTLIFDVYATNAATRYIALFRCYDSDGTNISGSVTAPSGWTYSSGYAALYFQGIVPGANAWYRITKQFTVPTDVAYVAISLQYYTGGDYYVWFDGVQFENKPYATSFIDDKR